MASGDDLVDKFNAFCAKKGQMNSKENGKLVKDCFKTKVKGVPVITNLTDTAFAKCKVKGQLYMIVDKENCNKFLKECASAFALKDKKFSEDEWNSQLTTEVTTSKKTTSGTAVAKDAAVARLTDAKGYTGSHKERFDESGKGKGIEGRVDRHAGDGYVGGYKQKGTYDQKHK